MLEASEPGIFAELVSISSTRSAGVSDSAYFIQSIELRPTFDLFLGARRALHFCRRVSSGETLISAVAFPRRSAAGAGLSGCPCAHVSTGRPVLSSLKLLEGDG